MESSGVEWTVTVDSVPWRIDSSGIDDAGACWRNFVLAVVSAMGSMWGCCVVCAAVDECQHSFCDTNHEPPIHDRCRTSGVVSLERRVGMAIEMVRCEVVEWTSSLRIHRETVSKSGRRFRGIDGSNRGRIGVVGGAAV